MEERWQNGLCREFTKAVEEIIKSNELSEQKYDLDRIGYEVVKLHSEVFCITK